MTKQEFTKSLEKWKQILGLNNWDIVVDYNEYNSAKNTFRTVLITDTHPEYCLAELKVKDLKNVDDKDVLHEMLHVLISEFADYAYDQTTGDKKRLLYSEERIVSQLANLILRKE